MQLLAPVDVRVVAEEGSSAGPMLPGDDWQYTCGELERVKGIEPSS
ncbi:MULTISPECIES: hypothetical protein [Halomonas]|nr:MULTISPECIES: hypothetical protein [Halomonas]MBZ0328962.1 hypothetical protein [Halomonas sp. ANAO-440]